MNTTETTPMSIVHSETTERSAPTRGRARSLLRRIGIDLAYIGAILLTSILAFVVWVTGLSLTLSLLVLVVGIFVWLGTVYVFRWTTWIDRRLAGWARGEPIGAIYREPGEPGVLARIRCVTTDPQTWKDAGWLV